MWGIDGGHGWWGFGILQMVLFWGVLIFGIVWLVRWLSEPSGAESSPPGKTSLDILKERYARGEIGKEEFEQKKLDLET